MASKQNSKSQIPYGDFQVVSISINLTGQRLLSDEILEISAYSCPEKRFSRIIQPRRINYNSIRNKEPQSPVRFKKLPTNNPTPITKTDVEYASLCELIDWLKETKRERDGIIVVFYSCTRYIISFLIDALERCDLTDDFFNIVQGFTNLHNLVVGKHDADHSLTALCKKWLTRKDFHEKKGFTLSCDDTAKYTKILFRKLIIVDRVITRHQFFNPATVREDEMAHLEKLRELESQCQVLWPVFLQKVLKSSKSPKALTLQRKLIEGDVDYKMLKEAFERQEKERVIDIITKTVNITKPEVEGTLESLFLPFKEDTCKIKLKGGNEGNESKTVPKTSLCNLI